MLLVSRRPGLCVVYSLQPNSTQAFFATRRKARSSQAEPFRGHRNDSNSRATFRRLSKPSRKQFRQHVQEEDRSGKDDPAHGVSETVHLRFRPGVHEFSRDRSQRTPNSPFETTPRQVSLLLNSRLNELELSLHQDVSLKRLNIGEDVWKRRFKAFKRQFVENAMDPSKSNHFVDKIRRLAPLKEEQALDAELKYAFMNQLLAAKTKSVETNHKALLDFRYPAEWYPATRGFLREFHVHVGPTNSGKTYHALKRLEQAESGVYAGPLRLLAHEIYMRLNAQGKRCALVTGDERKMPDEIPEPAPMTSCTVEMVPLNVPFDVAIIDEIQMLGSEDRGWAWTQAVLGVMAREVHVCGEERSLPIIQALAASCGDKLHVHRYERLSPLKMMDRSLGGNLKNLRKGDCVVGFSIMVLHGMRQLIEKTWNRKCAIIYGSLPPETRAQQARLFNDPDNDYDFLVASNAVGMGLNLSIKRMIFQSSHRNMKGKLIPMPIPEIKQIAGRAGRYSTASDDMKKVSASPTDGATNASEPEARSKEKQIGLVTTLEKFDHTFIEHAMQTDPEPLTFAGLLPPAFAVERFARYFPSGTPFSYLLMRMHDLSWTNNRFFLCDLRSQVAIADAIEPVKGLSTTDRLTFCAAPIEPRKAGESQLAREYALLVAESRGASVLEIQGLDLDLLRDDYAANREYLKRLEGLHKGLIVFMWLSFRFVGCFLDRELAQHARDLTEKRIEDTLAQLSFDYGRLRKKREQAILDMLSEGQEEVPADRNSLPTSQADSQPRGQEYDETTLAVADGEQVEAEDLETKAREEEDDIEEVDDDDGDADIDLGLGQQKKDDRDHELAQS